MFQPGSTFGNYTIEQSLGAGAMGVVYKARDNRKDQIVALKLIDDKLSRSADYRQRLADEAEAAGRIDSENVVGVYEYSECDGHPFIALEYVPGDDLRTACDNFNFNQKIDVIRQIATGLKAAHDNDVVHRDLKPENIKITDDNIVKILDFGLAKTISADSVDHQGNIEGTLHYLSPEQITGEPPTFSSDIFSLGVIAYELFTDLRPFEGDYSAAIIYSILHEEPDPPGDCNSELPGWFDVLVMKLLAKQPSERYESIQAVLDYIENCLAGADQAAPITAARTRQTVTVIDLKNLSDDDSWEYFCVGFTDDLISELSRRTNLIISAEPSSVYSRNVREVFRRCRSDFVIVGSLMKWHEKIKLNLTVYGDHGEKLVSGKNYEADSQDIFKILSQAVLDTSTALEEITDLSDIDVEDYFKTDIAAYDYYLKGKNYYQTNKPDELLLAERMFEKALEIDPNLAFAYSGLSDVYAYQYMAYYDRSQERIDLAREKADKAICIAPDLPEAHRSLGRYFMFIGDFEKAELSFLKAVELNPKYAIGYRTLAWMKELQGDHEGAIVWAKKSLGFAPNDLETLLLLSLVNMDLRKYTVAMATLRRAIELAPDYGRAYFNLGTVYLKLGVINKALENFEMAIKYKGDPNAWIDAGFIYLVNKKYERARHLLEESIREDYFPFIALYLLAWIEKLEGDNDKANIYFNKALVSIRKSVEEDQDNIFLKSYLAMTLAAAGEKDEALGILSELEQLEIEDGEILLNSARARTFISDQTEVRRTLKKALKAHAGPSEKQIAIDPHFAELALKLDK